MLDLTSQPLNGKVRYDTNDNKDSNTSYNSRSNTPTHIAYLFVHSFQLLNDQIDLNRFTLERYRSIVKYKTAFYSFYLPVALGMIVSGIRDVNLYQKAREILLIMGEYFQIQDDYLDCYGAPAVIGKIGTDIEDNKCSWLVVQALARVNPKQRELLEANYGDNYPLLSSLIHHKDTPPSTLVLSYSHPYPFNIPTYLLSTGMHDKAKVAKIKKLYNELDLKTVFEEYEEFSYQVKFIINFLRLCCSLNVFLSYSPLLTCYPTKLRINHPPLSPSCHSPSPSHTHHITSHHTRRFKSCSTRFTACPKMFLKSCSRKFTNVPSKLPIVPPFLPPPLPNA